MDNVYEDTSSLLDDATYENLMKKVDELSEELLEDMQMKPTRIEKRKEYVMDVKILSHSLNTKSVLLLITNEVKQLQEGIIRYNLTVMEAVNPKDNVPIQTLGRNFSVGKTGYISYKEYLDDFFYFSLVYHRIFELQGYYMYNDTTMNLDFHSFPILNIPPGYILYQSRLSNSQKKYIRENHIQSYINHN
jgi:hypothetical protein